MMTNNRITKNQRMSEEALYEELQKFEPFIQQALRQTSYQEREDLQQELRLKCIEKILTYEPPEVPGFWEYKRRYEQQAEE